MKICVPVKWVIDSVKPVQASDDGQHIQMEGVKMHMDPLSAIALSKAVDFKTARIADSVVAVTVGDWQTEPVLRTALAMGADSAMRFDRVSQSAFETAWVIADFVKNNAIQMVLCGHRSSDSASGQMGAMLASFLQYPFVSHATDIICNAHISVSSIYENTQVTYSYSLPIVIGCDMGVSVAKFPSLPRKLYVKNRHIAHIQIDTLFKDKSIQVVHYQSALRSENTAQKIKVAQLCDMLNEEHTK